MNILTFDIEEWFHILDNPSTRTVNEWCNYESRIRVDTDRILSILDNHKQKATFFCLGWIAQTHPGIIKEIISQGHEIGSHSHMHQLVYEQQPADFAKDVETSVKTLEDITGQRIRYFRAPGFSITEDTKWAFEILAKFGIEVDCSIFPVSRAHGGFQSYKSPVPSIIKYNGIEIRELPISYLKLLGIPVIYSGGGYFRLFPYHLIKSWTRSSKYLMSYLHPRDFDADQPLISELSLYRRFKSYTGLRSTSKKLDLWLNEFEFINISAAIDKIDWELVPRVQL